jgi:excisionase family DNA binding protein
VEIRAREDSAASLEQLLDVKQVAELLGETEQWVYRQAQTKKMPSIKMGKYWKFSPSQLQKWLERKQTP